MIRKVWFEEFRALRKVSVDLERLTVFVGPNSSGKTSILEGTHYLLQMAPRQRVEVCAELSRSGGGNSNATGPVVIGGWFGHQEPPDLFEMRAQPEQRASGTQKSERVRCGGVESESVDGNTVTPLAHRAEYKALTEEMGPAVFLRMSARQLSAPAYEEEEIPRVAPDGSGLASVIADLAAREPERVVAITDALRRIVPSVRRIRAMRAKVAARAQEVWGHRIVLDTSSGTNIPLNAASEGTTLALGLMTLLHGAAPPKIILFDDIDRGLHPKAQEELVRVLRAVMRERPELQVLATTHSPFVLNELDYSEVRLTTLIDDGSVIVGALTDHPDYPRWKDHVRPGELWTSALEDWLKQRPTKDAA